MKYLYIIFLGLFLTTCQKPDPQPTVPMMLLGNWEKTELLIDDIVTQFDPLRLEFTADELLIESDSASFTVRWEYIREGTRDILLIIQGTSIREKEIDFISYDEVYFRIQPDCNCVEKFEKR